MTNRVFVTGIGMITPVGLDTASTWSSLVNGVSGVDHISSFDPEGLDTRFHLDFDASGGRVLRIGVQHMAPEQNLAVQTAVIARARAFVGTYGGYSYLTPFCGVPSLAFYSQRTFKVQHLHVAQRAFEQLGGSTLVAIDVANLALVRLALADGVVTAL